VLKSRSKPGSKIFFIIRLVILALSIAVLLRIVDFTQVFYTIGNTPWYILFILVAIGIIRTWLTAQRWQLLNPDLTGQLKSWHYFRFYMIANAFNLVMPGALGGDLIRTAYTLQEVKTKRIDNLIAIVADRFIGLLSILLLGTLALVLAPDLPRQSFFYQIFGALIAGFIFIVTIISNTRAINLMQSIGNRLGKVGQLLNRLLLVWKEALHFFKTHHRNLWAALLICLPVHFISFLSAYILARSLGINISFFNISLIIALVWLVTAIPLTLAGAGVRELSMIYLFSIYGVDAEPATALSIYIYLVSLLLGLIGLLFLIDWAKLAQRIK